MDRWQEYREGKLKLPAVVQWDRSGVLVATDGGYRGPYAEVKGESEPYYLTLAAQPLPDKTDAPAEDYRTKYETLQASIDRIDTAALKTVIVEELSKLKTKITEKPLAEVK